METANAMKVKAEAHVELDGVKHEIPAGPTVVSTIKAELGVDPAWSLFVKDHGKRRLLADDEIVHVKNGLHFEAIPGGGVS